jgi:hypothetical protein
MRLHSAASKERVATPGFRSAGQGLFAGIADVEDFVEADDMQGAHDGRADIGQAQPSPGFDEGAVGDEEELMPTESMKVTCRMSTTTRQPGVLPGASAWRKGSRVWWSISPATLITRAPWAVVSVTDS